MGPRDVAGGVRVRRRPDLRPDARWIAPLGAALVLLIALAWWRPWQGEAPSQPQLLPLVPTPTIATATPVPDRIALPQATPTRAATPAATLAVAASPEQAVPRAPGTLLYSGTVNGKRGIAVASADGREVRLVAEGEYERLAWAPGGERFAAIGGLADRTYQLAIFAADGRALARYPFAGRVDRLIWSPDGAALVCAVERGQEGLAGQPGGTETWLIDGRGEPRRIELPGQREVAPFAWPAVGQLYLASYDVTGAQFAVWLIGADGNRSVRDLGGALFPIGFASDGALVVVEPGADPAAQPRGPGSSGPAAIAAIGFVSGGPRPIIEAEALAQRAFGPPQGAESATFTAGALAPGGDMLALVVSRRFARGTPRPGGATEASALVFVRLDGTVTGVAPLAAGEWFAFADWSPDGALLATYRFGSVTNEYALQIIDREGALRGSYRTAATPSVSGGGHAWSPDSRWLAYDGPGGITIVSAVTFHSPYPLGAQGHHPAWKPR
jgi:hypothetical protein